MSTARDERFAIVVPLVEGAEPAVEELLEAGPPFDLACRRASTGTRSSSTSDEAIFVFESRDGTEAVEAMLAEPEMASGHGCLAAAHGRPAAAGTARLRLVAARAPRPTRRCCRPACATAERLTAGCG